MGSAKLWNITELDDDNSDAKKSYQKLADKIDKEEITLKSRKAISVTVKVAASIIILISMSVGYFVYNQNNLKVKNANYIVTHIPYGEKGQVTLSDGTKVWLNSGSSLKYNAEFSKKNRTVILEGEAYFDVEKDESRPFFVDARGLTIKVLGTEFNVSCYEEDDEIKTTLVEGKVEIFGSDAIRLPEKILLKPNESANYSRSQRKIAVTKVEQIEDTKIADESDLRKVENNLEKLETVAPIIESIISWKNNHLIFDNATLEEMAVKMERWYGVDIILEDSSLHENIYSGKFMYNEPIEQVLDVISRTTSIEYTINRNTVKIRVK
jgi:ferric-dicitrate binding protein FerR (iron transport regulator)